MCSMITFITDKNNIMQAVQPMKMPWWWKLEAAESDQVILPKAS